MINFQIDICPLCNKKISHEYNRYEYVYSCKTKIRQDEFGLIFPLFTNHYEVKINDKAISSQYIYVYPYILDNFSSGISNIYKIVNNSIKYILRTHNIFPMSEDKLINKLNMIITLS